MKSWYLLYCKRGQIERAQQHLQQQAIATFTPRFNTEKIVRNKRVWVEEPLFPNYLFIQFDPEAVHTTTISATRGVSNFVRIGKIPAVVPDALIKQLQQQVFGTVENTSIPQKGDKVILNQGVFKGLEAIYAESDGETRSILLISMLGQSVKKSVENCDFNKLEA